MHSLNEEVFPPIILSNLYTIRCHICQDRLKPNCKEGREEKESVFVGTFLAEEEEAKVCFSYEYETQ